MRAFAVSIVAVWLLAMPFLFGSCSGSSDSTEGDGLDSALIIPRSDLATSNELKSPTGVTWIVHQTPMLDSSLVNILVEVRLAGDTLAVDFGEADPVHGIILDDLDKDGYQELYIDTRSPDPEAYGTIYGIYSEKDESVAMIFYEGATPYTMKEGEPYDGYRGHDQFRFEQGKLTNAVPVFKPEDNDSLPSGGTRTITYELVKSPEAVRLRPSWKK